MTTTIPRPRAGSRHRLICAESTGHPGPCTSAALEIGGVVAHAIADDASQTVYLEAAPTELTLAQAERLARGLLALVAASREPRVDEPAAPAHARGCERDHGDDEACAAGWPAGRGGVVIHGRPGSPRIHVDGDPATDPDLAAAVERAEQAATLW